MGKKLLSVGLDVGTTSTQMILSELTVENRASAFSVPEMAIARRRILYESPIHFTPLLSGERVDGQALQQLVAAEYQNAGIGREDVDTGAVIITGETSRKENAATVLSSLAGFAGDFVVATAGPELESVLAARGAGAVAHSAETGQTVLHMDIGGGTSNLALIKNGKITATGCLNVGGRLLKFGKNGEITYISPVLEGIFPEKVGTVPAPAALEALAQTLVSALEMAAGLREETPLLDRLWTKGVQKQLLPAEMISFSGGVADCIETEHPRLAFGDLGVILGKAIRRSRLCRGSYRLGSQTIRATVIGAGCHATQLSGSTVFHQNIPFPLKNLPVVATPEELSRLDSPGVLAIAPTQVTYAAISALAAGLAGKWPAQPLILCMEQDMAKALGQALALRLPKTASILCIDRVGLRPGDYLDVGAPIATALPVVVKTLAFEK